MLPQLIALIVHRLNGAVPLLQALLVAGQVEPGDGHLPGDDGVRGRPAVPDHEDELGVGEELHHVRAHLDGQGVLVAEPRGRFAVLRDDFQRERRYGRVQDRLRDSGLLQAQGLLRGLEPVEAELQEAGYDAGLLAASGRNLGFRGLPCEAGT